MKVRHRLGLDGLDEGSCSQMGVGWTIGQGESDGWIVF